MNNKKTGHLSGEWQEDQITKEFGKNILLHNIF
jgi:hypothetical protein